MSATSLRMTDRTYSPAVRKWLQGVMCLAIAVYAVVLWLLVVRPEVGLRLLWFAAIPLAPMILLVAPNAWVSVCPVSTVQTLSHRMGREPKVRLSPQATQRLQTLGWVLMIVGIPSRHIVFNSVGLATFWAAVAVSGAALVIGLSFKSLSGWCVGLCPIRPIEVLYGQFALDKNRPEKCTECSTCIARCLRLTPEKGPKELTRSHVSAHLAMGFPGFVAAYFLLDLLGICNVEREYFATSASTLASWPGEVVTVYGFMLAGFAVSWAVFAALSRAWRDSRRLFRAVAISAFAAYYLGVAPEICMAWGWSYWVVAPLLVAPLLALVWVLRSGRRK